MSHCIYGRVWANPSADDRKSPIFDLKLEALLQRAHDADYRKALAFNLFANHDQGAKSPLLTSATRVHEIIDGCHSQYKQTHLRYLSLTRLDLEAG